LKERYPHEHIYGFFPKRGLNRHNGLEIADVFDVELPPKNKQFNLFFLFIFYINKIFTKLKLSLSIISTDTFCYENAFFHDGYWQDKRFFVKNFIMNFRQVTLQNDNIKYSEIINNNNSVSIHIRRGDYLNSDNLYKMCSKNYYTDAINIVKRQIEKPYFIFFSDDPQWVKENFDEERMCIIIGNTGKQSFIDLYLMTKCKANIIANSTFSYWGAYLNKSSKLIIYPKDWFNYGIESPNITLNNWIGL
jgi:hypothetical protein